MIRLVALSFLLAVCAGCVNHLPKPTNANGSINPSVTVAEAEITFRNYAADSAKYAQTCHAQPTTVGCSEATITNLKTASNKAWVALQAAENAVRTLPQGASGIDAAIADLNAALIFFQALTAQIPAAIKGH